MPDINKLIQHPDTHSPSRADREFDLVDLSEDQG